MLRQATSSPFGQSVLLFLGLAIVGAVIAWLFQSLIVPLIISFVMYSLLESYCSRLIGHGLSPMVAISLVVLGVVVIIVALILIVAPVIFAQIAQLQSQLPLLWDKLTQLGQYTNLWLEAALNIKLENNEPGSTWFDAIGVLGGDVRVSSSSIMVQLGMALFLIPLTTFFLLKDFRVVRNYILGWLPNSGFELGWLIYYRIAKQLRCYLQGVIVQSSVVACITTIGFYLVGLELAFLYGVIAGVLNIIPYLGPILAMLPPMLIEVSTGNPDVWLMLGIFSILLLAQVIDNIVVVSPVVDGNVNLHPMVIVFGVIIVGLMFGIAGLLLAVPVITSVKIIFTGLYCGFKRA